MKLLVVTQAVDEKDPGLGFFTEWLKVLAPHFSGIEAVCLRAGAHALPESVHVHSLGKENRPPRFARRAVYAFRFLRFAWRLRREYDAVFVHMNQEYVLIAGPLWKLLGKPIYMWRNHYAGSRLTDLAAAFCTKVFCTSRYSYTARYKKTVLMPVGADTALFHPDSDARFAPCSVLFLARMAPSKRAETLIEALALLRQQGAAFTASLVGSPLPEHVPYHEGLAALVRARGLDDAVSFLPGPQKSDAPVFYRAHDVFVNCSPSGMFDKTLFEAAACGALVLAASEDWKALAGEDCWYDGTPESLAGKLDALLSLLPAERAALSARLQSIAATNSLDALAAALASQMRP